MEYRLSHCHRLNKWYILLLYSNNNKCYTATSVVQVVVLLAVVVRLSRDSGRRRGLEQTGEGDFVAVVVVLRQHDVLLVAVVGSEYSLNRRCLWPGRSTACKYAWPLRMIIATGDQNHISVADDDGCLDFSLIFFFVGKTLICLSFYEVIWMCWPDPGYN